MKNSKKALIVGIVAAVVILAGVLALLLVRCEDAAPTATQPATTGEQVLDTTLYWNVDRALYDGKSEAGMSSRAPEADGFFHVRFFVDGQIITLKVTNRKLVNSLEPQSLMGLEYDENGFVTDVISVDDMPVQKVAWQFYVQSFGGTSLKVNSSSSMNGIELLLEDIDPNHIFDMSGCEGPVGTVVKPIALDRVYIVADMDGNVTDVYIYDRPNFMLTHEAECAHCGKTVTWSEWTKENELPVRTGHYQLQNDVKLKAQAAQQTDTKICLDLNGKRVDGAENTRVFSMHNSGTELAIMDTSEGKTGVMAAHGTSAQGLVVWVRYGRFYLYGGTLDASDSVSNKNGAAVCLEKNNYFYMYGGTLIGGKAIYRYNETTKKYSNGVGGTLSMAGKFVMYDGEIRDGYAETVITAYNKDGSPKSYSRGYGGNIYIGNGGVMEMHGGVIKNGRAGNVGGNIYMDGTAELTIYGGSIKGGTISGKTRNGGSIYLTSKAKLRMDGGSITGGSCRNGGGNIYMNGTFIMNGGYIGGGVIRNYTTGKVVEDAAHRNIFVVNGEFQMYGGKVDGGVRATDSNATDNKKCKMVLSAYATIDGGEKSNRNLTLSLGAGGPVELMVGQLYDEARIRVNAVTGLFTKPAKEHNVDNFVSDVPGADIIYHEGCIGLGKVSCLCGQETHLGKCDGKARVWIPLTAASQLSAGGDYYLTGDFSAAQVGIGQDIVTSLDLNGHTYRATDTNCFLINGTGAHLNLCDHAGGGSLRGRGFATPNQGGTMYVRVGALDIYGGTLTQTDDHRTTNHGGVLSVRGTVNMYGGQIQGGKSPLGGNVSVTSSGQFILHDGLISGGTAGKGGNFYVAGKGKLHILGGQVENGDIMALSAAELTLAGGQLDAVTLDNEDGPVGLTLSGKLKVAKLSVPAGILADVSGLDGASEICVNAGGYFAQGATNGILAGFRHVRSDLDIALEGDRLFVGRMACLCGQATHVGDCDGKQVPWMPLLNTASLATPGNYYLLEDMTTGQISPKAGPISLDLNGHCLSAKAGRVLMPYEKVTLNICDHAGGGKLLGMAYTPGNEAQGGVIYVRAGSTLNVYGGTLGQAEGYGAANHGGILSVRGTANIYAGEIIGGKATLYGSAVSVTMASGQLNLLGGKVSGGSIYVTQGKANLSGGTAEEIWAAVGGKVTVSAKASNVIVSGGTLTLSGKALVNSLLTQADEEGNKPTVTVAELTEGASVTLADAMPDGTFTDATGGKYLAFFHTNATNRGLYAIDNQVYGDEVGALYLGRYHCLCGSQTHLGTCDGKSVKWTALDSTNTALLTTAGNYYLTSHVTVGQTAPKAGVAVSLDLNGFTLSASASRAFMTYDTLNICDSVGGGQVLGKGWAAGKGDQGGVIYVRAGSVLNLYGGTIGQAKGYGEAKYGGIVQVRGTFNMYGGAVTGGKATEYGGAVSVDRATGSFNLYGGTVSGGTAPLGGDLYVTAGKASLSGGTVGDVYGAVGSQVTVSAKAEKVTVSGGTLKLSGKPVIDLLSLETDAEGNKPVLTAAGALTEGAAVTVTDQLPDGVFSDNTLGAYAAFFTSKDEDRGVYAIDNEAYGDEVGALYLGVYHCLCGQDPHVGTCDGKAIKWTALTDPVSLKSGGSYYLTEDVSTAQLSLGSGIVTSLDLNGHHFIASASNAFLINGNAATRLSICDHAGGGSLQGRGFATANQGGAVYIRAGNMDLYSGTIRKADNYQVTNHGGLLSVRGTFHMYGGAITGGTSQQYGGNVSVSSTGICYIHGGTISGGSSPKGGNICVTGSAKLYIQGGTVENGIASESGGNVYVDKQNTVTFEMSAGQLLGGTATVSGGNLFVLDAVGTKSITGGTVTGGTAPTGSCAYVAAGTLAVGKDATVEKLETP